jgi:alpha-beta hydrolase superfamily lysophospholipase
VHRGLEVGAPVLVLSSTRSGTEAQLGDAAMSTDVVLDVEQIRRWAPSLGRHVTIAQVEGAMHDVTLSRQPARDRVFDELGRWLDAYIDR